MTDAELLAALIAERETTNWWWTGTHHADATQAASRRDQALRDAFPNDFPTRRQLAERRRDLKARRREAFIDDVAWLIDSGCGWAEVLHRLDLPADTIGRRLHRWGRHDLARYFDGLQRSAA